MGSTLRQNICLFWVFLTYLATTGKRTYVRLGATGKRAYVRLGSRSAMRFSSRRM